MALSIGVAVDDTITVGSGLVRIQSFPETHVIVIEVINEGVTTEHIVTGKERLKIMPDVFVQVGLGPAASGNRLAFEAPRRIAINRVPADATRR